MRRYALTLALCVSAACGSSPSAPSRPNVPEVSGEYSGYAMVAFEGDGPVSCPAETIVTQDGETVRIAPLELAGACIGSALAFSPLTITEQGRIESGGGGAYSEAGCVYTYSPEGLFRPAPAGTYSRGELRMTMAATSASCWNFTVIAELSRE